MGWFKRRKEDEEAKTASLVATMATAFAQALGSVLTAQTEGIKQQGAFLGTLQDLSAKKAAVVLGQKGGRSTQRRKREAKEQRRQVQECVLCNDPMHRGTTLEQINFHRTHEGISSQLSLPPPDEENRNGSNGNGPEI